MHHSVRYVWLFGLWWPVDGDAHFDWLLYLLTGQVGLNESSRHKLLACLLAVFTVHFSLSCSKTTGCTFWHNGTDLSLLSQLAISTFRYSLQTGGRCKESSSILNSLFR
ncbi:conserved hypothetical protein [Trichinella spiralis]|uniref:hypothetical protein n=1 Tax=Trichinella spiralis TaxID=6334 RepID=UPI0001EFE23C|nr:conserved hypothetical protein [Trichinella spiralis]